jgi:hypothetical protein
VAPSVDLREVSLTEQLIEVEDVVVDLFVYGLVRGGRLHRSLSNQCFGVYIILIQTLRIFPTFRRRSQLRPNVRTSAPLTHPLTLSLKRCSPFDVQCNIIIIPILLLYLLRIKQCSQSKVSPTFPIRVSSVRSSNRAQFSNRRASTTPSIGNSP